MFQFLYGAIRRWDDKKNMVKPSGFNSYMVRLEVPVAQLMPGMGLKFQFLYGAIGSRLE